MVTASLIELVSCFCDIIALFLVAMFTDWKLESPLAWILVWAITFNVIFLDSLVLPYKFYEWRFVSAFFHLASLCISVFNITIITLNIETKSPMLNISSGATKVMKKLASSHTFLGFCAVCLGCKLAITIISMLKSRNRQPDPVRDPEREALETADPWRSLPGAELPFGEPQRMGQSLPAHSLGSRAAIDKEETSQVTAVPEKVNLKSSDGQMFEVDMKVASLSGMLKNTIDNSGRFCTVPVPEVAGNILAKVIEYCKKHAEASPTEDLKEWDSEFVKVDQATLFDLVKAANYLEIEGLIHVTNRRLVTILKMDFLERFKEKQP